MPEYVEKQLETRFLEWHDWTKPNSLHPHISLLYAIFLSLVLVIILIYLSNMQSKYIFPICNLVMPSKFHNHTYIWLYIPVIYLQCRSTGQKTSHWQPLDESPTWVATRIPRCGCSHRQKESSSALYTLACPLHTLQRPAFLQTETLIMFKCIFHRL